MAGWNDDERPIIDAVGETCGTLAILFVILLAVIFFAFSIALTVR